MVTSYTYRDHIETVRLLTRFLTPEDITLWADFFKDKDALEFFPAFNFTTNEEIAKWWIEKQLTRYQQKQFGLQALINKETKELVGQCGLLTQEVDGVTEVEVAYHVFKKYWGQGFAPEAARVFIDYAFQNNVADTVVSIIDVRNVKAQSVAVKAGLSREKQTRWSDHDVYIYRIRKED